MFTLQRPLFLERVEWQFAQNKKIQTGNYRAGARPVPELTCSVGIQLNERVSLWRHPRALLSLQRTISPIRTHTRAKSSGDHITPAALFAFQNMGDFELHSPKRNLIDDQSLSSGREEPVRNKGMPDGASGSADTEQKSPTKSATGLRRLGALWPAVWLALAGVATLGWLIGILWAAVKLVRWLID